MKFPSTPTWLICLVLLNFMDAVNTHYLLQHGATEANPLMRWAYDLSPGWFFVIKMGMVTAAAFGIYYSLKRGPLPNSKWVRATLAGVTTLYVGIVASQFYMISLVG